MSRSKKKRVSKRTAISGEELAAVAGGMRPPELHGPEGRIGASAGARPGKRTEAAPRTRSDVKSILAVGAGGAALMGGAAAVAAYSDRK
jgi:hypothetical protein